MILPAVKIETPVVAKIETPAIARARELLRRLETRGFRAWLDKNGALLIGDATGRRRHPFGAESSKLTFEILNAGLNDNPKLLK